MNKMACKAAVFLGVVIGAFSVSPALAQRSALTVRGVVEGDIVEGLVTRADPLSRTITLDNGQEYAVPRALALDWELLHRGAAVRMRYSVDGGRNIATALDIRS